jgi:hypothetical protein
MNTLNIPLIIFRNLLLALRQSGARSALLRVGTNHNDGDHEWLARDFTFTDDWRSAGPQPAFLVSMIAQPPAISLAEDQLAQAPESVSGLIYLSDNRLRGQAWGFVRTPGSIVRLDRIVMPGCGMPVVSLRREPGTVLSRQADWQELLMRVRYSRSIGALGGEAVWRRLVGLRYAIIGCGRSGSLVAAGLAQLGVAHLALIDPDELEAHNHGEMEIVFDSDTGRPKAAAVAERLRQRFSRSAGTIIPVIQPITHPDAVAIAKRCDVLICCADNDAARLQSALLSTLYHKALIDIGAGIQFSTDESQQQSVSPAVSWLQRPAPRLMGADVRLILPGDGCLLCRGSLADYQQAVADLLSRRPSRLSAQPWHQQRAGSLHSLNQMAVATGRQMLQELVAERLDASLWAHLEISRDGRLSVNYPQVNVSSDCVLCMKSGLGDTAYR